MKLKYYLRTLGIGIFVTTLMLAISSGFHKMSDEQVIQRAKELGMVEAKNQVLSELREEQNNKPSQEDSIPSTTETEESKTEDEKPTEESTEESVENSSEQESVEEPQESAEPTVESQTPQEPQEEQIQESSTAQETTDNNTVEQNETPEIIEIVIVRGDSSVSVSQKLYKAGLVSSAADYDRYLCRNKYDYNISVGTYQIPVGSTEEQIAKIITRK